MWTTELMENGRGGETRVASERTPLNPESKKGGKASERKNTRVKQERVERPYLCGD